MGGLLSRVFGGGGNTNTKKQKQALSSKDQAKLDLKRQRDRLTRDTKKLDAVIAKEKEMALKLFRDGKKDRAMLVLKKKKFQENQLEKMRNLQLNVEQLLGSIDFASVQNEVFAALKEGNEALKKLNAEVSIDEVEQLMDDTAEAVEYQQQISALLGQELTADDDADVLAELEAIENEDIEALDLPDAPSQPLAAAEEKEEPVSTEDAAPQQAKAKPQLVAA